MTRSLLELLHHWHIDVPTLVGTLLFLPLARFFLGIIRKHGKDWGGYLLEGTLYWFGRLFVHSVAARFTLRRYCRIELSKENQYLYVPSKAEVKLEIDKVFVNLTLEQGELPGSYNQNTIFSAGNRVRVIGDPGSGKSSLVKRLFRNACRAAISKPSKAKLPILIELRNLVVPPNTPRERLGLWFYAHLRKMAKKSEVYEMDDCFDSYARISGLLVLLDGLDEVASSEFEQMQAAVLALSEHLSNLSPDNIIVLTMRTQLHQQVREAFRGSFGRALFVNPFTPSDIYEFLERWPATDRRFGSSIYAELSDRPTLREMCTNPLVLAMYVADRQAGSDPLTPESRTDFYKKVLEELLLKRRLRQTGPTLAPGKLREQRERVLGRLAYEHLLDLSQPANSLRWRAAINVVKDVMKYTEAEAVKAFLQIAKDTGLVTEEKPQETFRFIHLTFCEFLAAHESIEGQKNGFESLIKAHQLFMEAPTRRALLGCLRLSRLLAAWFHASVAMKSSPP